MPFDEESLIQEALRNIYNSSVDVRDQIEPNLYAATSKTYRKAVDEGFGTVKWGEPDYDFLHALKHNTDVLAAFKTHRQQNDIAALMIGEDGKLKPFAKFQQDVEGLIGKYNHNWLTTEYNTAVIRARNAAKWKDFERDADLYPNLKWMETTSPNPDMVVHFRYWNRIWALTDPFWRRHYPGDRWTCKCELTNTDEPVTDNSDIDREPEQVKQTPGLDSNPGISGEVFTPTHPYIKEAYQGAEQAVKQFIKENAYKERLKEIREEAAFLKKEALYNEQFDRNIRVTGRGIKEWLNQPHAHYAAKNDLLLDIKDVIRKAIYLGWGEDKHDNRVRVHLFETIIGGDKSWILVKEQADGDISLYSISDSDNILKVLNKKATP